MFVSSPPVGAAVGAGSIRSGIGMDNDMGIDALGGIGEEDWRLSAEEHEAARRFLAELSDVESLWAMLLGEHEPIATRRQVQAVTARVAEFLEQTALAGGFHPSERPLRGLLERCLRITGEYELDTTTLLMDLRRAIVELPPLPLPAGTDGEPEWLGVRVMLWQPPDLEGANDLLGVQPLVDGPLRDVEVTELLGLPVLAGAVRDHLLDALPTSTVLSRTATTGEEVERPELAADADADAARAADRLVDLFAGLEHALARRDGHGRDPDGDSPVEGEVEHRRRILFADARAIRVHVHQTLPAGTLEPVRLIVEGKTGEDPDGYGLNPLSYKLIVDLREEQRGHGRLEVAGASGRAQREVLLPRTTLLWTDHIDSALRRANVVVPAVRRSPFDEHLAPAPEVDPPVHSVWEQMLESLQNLPF